MKKFTGYMAGINLGGWLSQYPHFDSAEALKAHQEHVITEPDIAQIASWGMDHVRLPVDYPVLDSGEGYGYIDKALEWAQKYNLNVVLDLHRTPGYSFDTQDQNTFLADANLHERFLQLWRDLAGRYKDIPADTLCYELLNEIFDSDSSHWNPLALKAIDEIRKIDPAHRIILGGVMGNSCRALKLLPVLTDPLIVYNFHTYDPFWTTHQKAGWVPELKDVTWQSRYPEDHPPAEWAKSTGYDGRVDIAWVRNNLKPAFDFQEEHDCVLYCGEYGVIEKADLTTRENLSADISEVLLEHGIGRAAWSYKGMDFPHIGNDGKPLSQQLIQAVSKQ
jgi:hypothetical protein